MVKYSCTGKKQGCTSPAVVGISAGTKLDFKNPQDFHQHMMLFLPQNTVGKVVSPIKAYYLGMG